MPRSTKPLTATEIDKAKPRAQEYSLGDGNGLYLRIMPSGKKLWLFNYLKPFTKQRTNISLGSLPPVTLAKARERREEYRRLLAEKIDPREHRVALELEEAEKHANTLQNVYEKWLNRKEPDVSEGYFNKIRNRLDTFIMPKLGKRPLYKITAVEVIEVITPLSDEGKLETVKKLCRWMNEIMVFAVNSGIIYSNPLSGIGKAFHAPRVNRMPTIKANQLPELMSVVEKASITPITKAMLQWQLHTMTRPAEAAGARWEEVDFEQRTWTVPPERMKGRKNPNSPDDRRQPHVIPLSPQLMGLLESLSAISGHREHLFPSSSSPRKSANSQTVNMALKRMGFKGQLVSHGFRALASTTLNEQGFDSDVIEAALAHVDGNQIRAAYNRADYLERRRVMMQWWSDCIEEAATGKEPKSGRKNLRAITSCRDA